MLLRLFKSNHPYVIFLVPIIGMALWLPSILDNHGHDLIGFDKNQTLLFQYLYSFIEDKTYGKQLIALSLCIIQSFIIIRLNFKYIFIETKTYLPAIIFILFCSATGSYQTLHPTLIANIFILLAVNQSFDFNKQPNQLKRYYESGLFLGIGGLFYVHTFYLLILLWLTLVILRTFSWREWISTIFGYVTPIAFYAIFLFLNNKFNAELSNYISLITTPTTLPQFNYINYLGIAVLGLFFLNALFFSLRISGIKKISTRKYFTLFFWYFTLCLGLIVFIPNTGLELTYIIATPIAIVFSLYFTENRKKWINEIIFTLILSIVLIIIWF